MAPNVYADHEDIKAAMPDQNWPTTAYDTQLDTYCTRASREFDRATNRPPGFYYVTTASARYFTGDGSLYLYPGEMAAAPTAVEVAETGVLSSLTAWSTSGDYHLLPFNAADEGQPYTGLMIDIYNAGSKTEWPAFPKCVKVTAKWGYSTTVPSEVEGAVITWAVRHFKRGQQGYQDAGAIQELGQLRYVKGVDPEIDDLIQRLRRQAI